MDKMPRPVLMCEYFLSMTQGKKLNCLWQSFDPGQIFVSEAAPSVILKWSTV